METARLEYTPSALKRTTSVGSRATPPSQLGLPCKLRRRISSSFPNPNGSSAAAAAAATSSSSSSSAGSSSSFPAADFDLATLRSLSYTSLRDLIPSSASVASPTAAASPTGGHFEVSIRNRLVKQAARAYLQPLSSSSSSQEVSGGRLLRRLWLRFSARHFRNPFAECLDFVGGSIFRSAADALDRFLRAVRIFVTRTW